MNNATQITEAIFTANAEGNIALIKALLVKVAREFGQAKRDRIIEDLKRANYGR